MHPPDVARDREALACLLTLRLVDHWTARDAAVIATDSPVLAATRRSLAALEHDAALRAALEAIVQLVVTLPGPDVQPIVPAIAALGVLLQERGHLHAAVDVHRTVARLADARAHLPLAFETQMRIGTCLTALGDARWADAAHAQAGVLATRGRNADWIARVATVRAPMAVTSAVA